MWAISAWSKEQQTRTTTTSRKIFLRLLRIKLGMNNPVKACGLWWKVVAIAAAEISRLVIQQSKKKSLLVLKFMILWRTRILMHSSVGGEKAAWGAFKVVVDTFLGKHKAPNYKTHVENMHKTFRNTECNMSFKLHFLRSHLVPPPPPPQQP